MYRRAWVIWLVSLQREVYQSTLSRLGRLGGLGAASSYVHASRPQLTPGSLASGGAALAALAVFHLLHQLAHLFAHRGVPDLTHFGKQLVLFFGDVVLRVLLQNFDLRLPLLVTRAEFADLADQ